MRSPRPAASTMAVRGMVIERWVDIASGIPCFRHRGARLGHRLATIRLLRLRWSLGNRDVLGVPIPQGLQRRMRQRPLQIGPYAGDVSEILRFAVALVEP